MKRLIALAGAFGLPFILALPLAAQPASGAAAPTIIDFLLRPKFLFMIILGLLAFVLLVSRRMNDRIKVPLLLVTTFLYGIAANLPVKFFSGFAMHPSPICSIAKAMLYGFRMPMIATLAVILFLTVLGPRLYCGWVCPVGAIQELIAMLADKLGIRRRKPDFRLSQTFRAGLFLAFIFLSWTAVIHSGGQDGKPIALSLYDYINAFHGFEFTAQPNLLAGLIHYLPFVLTLGFAFLTYRPFCYFVCPVGLVANVFEQIALFRVIRRKAGCTDCGLCAKKAPCPTVPEMLKGSKLRPDCFSCTVCVNKCECGLFSFEVKENGVEAVKRTTKTI